MNVEEAENNIVQDLVLVKEVNLKDKMRMLDQVDKFDDQLVWLRSRTQDEGKHKQKAERVRDLVTRFIDTLKHAVFINREA